MGCYGLITARLSDSSAWIFSIMASCNLQADGLLCANHGNDVGNNRLEVVVNLDAWHTVPGDISEFIDADISPFVFK